MKESEKAKELFDKMYNVDDVIGNYPMCFDTAKQCALIAVDEIINMPFLEYSRYKNTFDDYFDDYTKSKYYWEEVKNEIKKYEIKR
jgi:hypothetical protein